MNLNFKELKKKFGASQYELGKDPSIDWSLALSVALGLSVALVIFSVIIFGIITAGSDFEDLEMASSEKANVGEPKLIEPVSAHFKSDSEFVDNILTAKSKLVDPSL